MKKTIFSIAMAMLWPKKSKTFYANFFFKCPPCIGFALLACVSLPKPTYAQDALTEVKIANKVKSTFWTQNHKIYEKGEVKIGDFSQLKGNIIILDFWATWCTTCFAKFPVIDSLSKLPDVKIVLVNSIHTRDTEAKVKDKLDVWAKKGMLQDVIQVYNDSYLLAAFPNRSLPHYVWIDRTGRVSAITGSDFLTRENVAKLINKRLPVIEIP